MRHSSSRVVWPIVIVAFIVLTAVGFRHVYMSDMTMPLPSVPYSEQPNYPGGDPTIWQQWYAVYGGAGTDVFNAVAADVTGLIAVGYSNSSDGDFTRNRGGFDAVVVKTSPTQGLIWQATFGGEGNDVFHAVAVSPQGDIYAVGDTASITGDFPMSYGGGTDAVIVKLDSTGGLTWAKTLGGNGDDSFRSLAIADDGSVVVAGFTTSSASGQDGVLAKLTPSGDIVWAKTFGGSGDDSFASVVISGQGNIFVVGKSNSPDGDFGNTNHAVNAVALVTTTDGDVTWAKSYGGTGMDEFNSVALAPNDTLVVVGDSSSQDGVFGDRNRAAGRIASLLATLTMDGNLIYHDESSSLLESDLTTSAVAVQADGTIIYVGTITYSNMTPPSRGMWVLITVQGTSGWSPYGDNSGVTNFTGLANLPGGGVAVVGYTAGDAVIVTFK